MCNRIHTPYTIIFRDRTSEKNGACVRSLSKKHTDCRLTERVGGQNAKREKRWKNTLTNGTQSDILSKSAARPAWHNEIPADERAREFEKT